MESESPKKNLTAVIVDDNQFMRSMLRKILGNIGFTVLGDYENAENLIKDFSRINPDLVTMDLVMEKLDGLNALKQILIISPQAKVIMISSIGKNEVVVNAIKEGAKDYILKPFDEKKIREILGRIFKF